MEYNEDKQTLTLDEFELHDILVSLNVLYHEDSSGMQPLDYDVYTISLKLTGYTDEKTGEHIQGTERDRKQIEVIVNELLEAMANAAAKMHDLFEYSC